MATKVVVSFEVDNAGAVTKIQQVKRELNDVPQSTAKATSGFLTLKNALMGVASSFVAIKLGQFMRESVQGAIEEQQVLTRLAATLATLGVSYNDVAVELQGLFEKVQATTRFSDDEAAAAFQKLAVVTGDYDSALKLLGPAMDLSIGRSIDLGTAADLAGKAATGYIGILSRYGIILDETTKRQLQLANASERAEIIAGVLNARFGGQAQSDVKSYAGQILQLKNNWDNLKETLGAAVLGMTEVRGGTSLLVKALVELKDVVIDVAVGWKFTLEATWSYIKTYFAAYVQAIRTFKETLANLWGVGLSEGIFGASSGSITTSLITAFQTFRTELDLLDEQLTDSLIWDVADVEKFRQSIQGLTNDASAAAGAIGGGGGGGVGGGAIGEGLADALGKLTERIYTALHTAQNRLLDYNDGVIDEILERWRERYVVEFPQIIADGFEGVPEALGPPTEEIADNTAEILGGMFSDMLGKGFMGELDSFSDLWDEIWQDMAKSMAGIIGDALEGALSGKDGSIKGLVTQLGSLAGTVAGLGMMAQSTQSGGGWASILSGAMGGAMVGMNPALLWATGGLSPIIGAIIGGALAYFGSQAAEDPETFVANLGLNTGQILTRGHQGYSGELQALWVRQQQGIMRQYISAYHDVLRLFEDESLFELIGTTPTFDTAGWMGMGADSLADWLQQEFWPSAFMNMFQEAISSGLEGLGVSSGTLDQLWQELEALPGEERMGALTTYVSALVDLSHLVADMDWNAIMDVVGQDSLTTFMLGMEDIARSVDMLMMGMSDMTLLERAEQAQEIEQLIVQVRQAEIQYLQQLDSLQKGINASIESMLEQFQLGDMNAGQQQTYYQQRIAEIMALLAGGSVSSPEQLQQLMADLQRYIQALAGSLGDQLFEPMDIMGWGQTWADYLSGMLTEAQGYSDAYFEQFRDEIRAANDELIEALRDLIDALTNFQGDAAGGGDGTTGWGGHGNPDPEGAYQPSVNVYLAGSMSALRPFVRAEIRDSLAGRPRGIN